MRRSVALGALFMSVVVLSLAMSVASAAKGNPRVLPPWSTPHGMTYGEWAGAWWDWALQFPTAQCPILDPDGSLALNGQSGSVYFLAGTFGEPAERWVTIPPGKSLFFPLINTCYWCPEDGPDEAAIREAAAWWIDRASLLAVTVDGVPLENLWDYRASSPPGGFLLHIPPGSISVTEWGYAPGDRYPSVADGYWVMLAPLPAGEHELWFRAEVEEMGWSLDVTYHLTVAPGAK